MSATLPNPPMSSAPPAPPRRADGEFYRYELIALTRGTRTYADGLDELVAALIDGYLTLGSAEKKKARRELAEALRAPLQGSLLARYEARGCSEEELAALRSSAIPRLAEWKAPVPLVLVDAWYAPETEVPRPRGPNAHPQQPAGIIWLSAASDRALLESLGSAGLVVLSERR